MMAVYVDPLMNHGWKLGNSCHLFTDGDVQELHDFAERIGMKRRWFQMSNSGIAHYDLVESRRKAAVKLGAIELDRRATVEKWRQIRAGKT